MSIEDIINKITDSLPQGVTLIAVSKTHPIEAVEEAYKSGQRFFGESRPQEMRSKWEAMPKDIKWHMIGHLQTNKVKMIANFVDFIHSVDSQRLIELINAEAAKVDRVINILLEVKVAQEESKHGWTLGELNAFIDSDEWRKLNNIRIRGIMGIATYTDDKEQIKTEFSELNRIFLRYKSIIGSDFDTLSMGMTSDYDLAIECGSNMIRVGSLIFGDREYNITQ